VARSYSFRCVYCGSSCLYIGFRAIALAFSPIETLDSCGSCGKKAENTRTVLVEKKMTTAHRVNSIRVKIK